MIVRWGRRRGPERQRGPAEIRVCPTRLTYETDVRREGPGETVRKVVWLVEVRLQETRPEPWLPLTGWPATDAMRAVRMFQMCRQR